MVLESHAYSVTVYSCTTGETNLCQGGSESSQLFSLCWVDCILSRPVAVLCLFMCKKSFHSNANCPSLFDGKKNYFKCFCLCSWGCIVDVTTEHVFFSGKEEFPKGVCCMFVEVSILKLQPLLRFLIQSSHKNHRNLIWLFHKDGNRTAVKWSMIHAGSTFWLICTPWMCSLKKVAIWWMYECQKLVRLGIVWLFRIRLKVDFRKGIKCLGHIHLYEVNWAVGMCVGRALWATLNKVVLIFLLKNSLISIQRRPLSGTRKNALSNRQEKTAQTILDKGPFFCEIQLKSITLHLSINDQETNSPLSADRQQVWILHSVKVEFVRHMHSGDGSPPTSQARGICFSPIIIKTWCFQPFWPKIPFRLFFCPLCTSVDSLELVLVFSKRPFCFVSLKLQVRSWRVNPGFSVQK